MTVIVNFKKLTGDEATRLALQLNEVDDALLDKYEIVLAVQAPDIVSISRCSKFTVFVQDTFSDEKDCFLRYFENLSSKGCRHVGGVILNHPEKKIGVELLEENILRARELDMRVLICATDVGEAIAFDKYTPSFIGLEKQELIGKDASFVNHCPEIVRQAKSHVGAEILIGAGIKSANDLRHVIDTGGSGVLVSSLILKSNNPSLTLTEFLN